MPVGWTAALVGLVCGGFCAVVGVDVISFVAVGAEVLRQKSTIGVLICLVRVGLGVPGVRAIPTADRVENKITTMDNKTSDSDTKTLTIKAIVSVVPGKLERCCKAYPHSGMDRKTNDRNFE